jgi:hypothetical protein
MHCLYFPPTTGLARLETLGFRERVKDEEGEVCMCMCVYVHVCVYVCMCVCVRI